MPSQSQKMDIKGVLFDLDGTLIDSKRDIASAANSARIHFGMPPLPLETLVGYIGWGIEHLNRQALGTDNPAQLAEGLEVLKSYYRDHCVDQTIVFPGTRELLENLKSRGLKMGLVSNKPHEFTLITLEKLGLRPFFQVALGEGPLAHKKPHPEPLLTVLRQLGVRPEDSIMIGDSTVDVEAARAAGMRVGIVSHGFVPKEYLAAAHPDWLVDSLAEFHKILN
jgi:2-phosphoglycolate phosphatase